jgi:hypothetical protein
MTLLSLREKNVNIPRHLMPPTRHNRTVFSLVLSPRRHNRNLWAALLTFGDA